MRAIKFAALAMLLGSVLCVSAGASDFSGSNVAWQYYAYGSAYTQEFGGGTSSGAFVMACTSCGDFDGYFTIDAGPSSITFNYTVCGTTGECPNFWSDSVLSLSPTIYNGIDMMFSGGPNITSVSVDAATNMAGFNSSYISFTGNEIQVDWHLLPFDSSTIVKLDLNGTSTPEPGTLILLGSGLLGAVGLARRKLSI